MCLPCVIIILFEKAKIMKLTGVMIEEIKTMFTGRPYQIEQAYENLIYALYCMQFAGQEFWGCKPNLSRSDFKKTRRYKIAQHPDVDVLSYFGHENAISNSTEGETFFNLISANDVKQVLTYFESHESNIINKIMLAMDKMVKNNYSMYYNRITYTYSRPIIGAMLANNLEIDDDVIKTLLPIYSKNNKKDAHSTTLRLILLGIEKNLDQTLLMQSFCNFVRTNELINPSAIGHMDKVKQAMQAWPLDMVFTLAEIKKLYDKNGAMFSKKTVGMYYEFDVNAMKKELKIDPKIIYNNAAILFEAMPNALASDPDYITSHMENNFPVVKCHVSFEENVSLEKIDALNNYCERCVISPVRLSVSIIEEEMQKLLLKSVLDKKLNLNEKNKTLRKI